MSVLAGERTLGCSLKKARIGQKQRVFPAVAWGGKQSSSLRVAWRLKHHQGKGDQQLKRS